jgi:hypothetical protein
MSVDPFANNDAQRGRRERAFQASDWWPQSRRTTRDAGGSAGPAALYSWELVTGSIILVGSVCVHKASTQPPTPCYKE